MKHDVAQLNEAAEQGDPAAAEQLLPLVYDALRELASRRLARERPGHTLSATGLVHEAYLRVFGDGEIQWDHRGHFFGAAAIAMKRILLDRARRPAKRMQRDPLTESIIAQHPELTRHLTVLDDVLSALESFDERKSRVVHLRVFAGLSHEQIARSLGISERTARSDWQFGKAWLLARLSERGVIR